jgi:DNA-binding ferritin-like protein (Dps family)
MNNKVLKSYHNLKQQAFLYNVKFLAFWALFSALEKLFLRSDAQMKRALLEKNPELLVGKKNRNNLLNTRITNSNFIRTQKNRCWIGGRGSAKTNTIGKLLHQMFQQLPRGICGFASLSFRHIETNLLPEIWSALDDLKIYRGQHYVYGVQPPKHWKRPYRKVEDYTYAISFINGFTVILFSNESGQVARGISIDALIGDEVAFFRPDFWSKKLLPTVRANKYKKIAKSPLHWGKFIFSSAPDTLEGQWIFNNELLAKQYPKEYFYIESTPLDNLDVLPADYVDNLRNSMTKIEFDIEVMNKRLEQLPNPFYPMFSEKQHVYECGYTIQAGKAVYDDYNPNKHLEISIDKNAAFTSLVVSQENSKSLDFVNEMWVKWDTVAALMEKFADEYKDHAKKTVHIYGDRNLYEVEINTGRTFVDIITTTLSNKGWIVVNNIAPANIEHSHKFTVVNHALKGLAKKAIRINKHSCKNLRLSILSTPCLDEYKKDKRSEKQNIEQEKATHLGDCFDYRCYPLFVSSTFAQEEATTAVAGITFM